MAPGLRTNIQGRTRAANRGDQHDDFEGLPIRQWKREKHTIAPPLREEPPKLNDKWTVELPHGMPRDSHLLPQHSQDLLRALRSGRFYKRPAPDDEEPEQENVAEKPEKKEEVQANIRAFSAPIWRALPRNAEGPEISHLAKRRKGTVILPSKATLLQSGLPTITKAKVKRLDAAGNSYLQDVTLAEGQSVDGEIVSTSVVTAPVAIRTTARDISTQVTHVKNKPVASRKKTIKGPGRGRKKKLPLAAPYRPEGGVGGDGATTEGGGSAAESNGAKLESENLSGHDSPTIDDDDGDDDEGDENEGEDENDQDHEMRDAPGSATEAPKNEVEENSPAADVAGSQTDTPSPIVLPPLAAEAKVEGSPLKNVVIASPLEPEPPMLPLAGSLLSHPENVPSAQPPPAAVLLQVGHQLSAAAELDSAATRPVAGTGDTPHSDHTAQEPEKSQRISPAKPWEDTKSSTPPKLEPPPQEHTVPLLPSGQVPVEQESLDKGDGDAKTGGTTEAGTTDSNSQVVPVTAKEESRDITPPLAPTEEQIVIQAEASGPESPRKERSPQPETIREPEPQATLPQVLETQDAAVSVPTTTTATMMMTYENPADSSGPRADSEPPQISMPAQQTPEADASAATDADDGDDLLGKLMGSLDEPAAANPSEIPIGQKDDIDASAPPSEEPPRDKAQSEDPIEARSFHETPVETPAEATAVESASLGGETEHVGGESKCNENDHDKTVQGEIIQGAPEVKSPEPVSS